MRRARKLDLLAGVLLGIVLGIVVVYLLVIVVGNSRDVSPVSTTQPPSSRGTMTGKGSAAGSPAPPGQRR